MKRISTSPKSDSDEDIWNYKSNKTVKSRRKTQLKNVCGRTSKPKAKASESNRQSENGLFKDVLRDKVSAPVPNDFDSTDISYFDSKDSVPHDKDNKVKSDIICRNSEATDCISSLSLVASAFHVVAIASAESLPSIIDFDNEKLNMSTEETAVDSFSFSPSSQPPSDSNSPQSPCYHPPSLRSGEEPDLSQSLYEVIDGSLSQYSQEQSDNKELLEVCDSCIPLHGADRMDYDDEDIWENCDDLFVTCDAGVSKLSNSSSIDACSTDVLDLDKLVTIDSAGSTSALTVNNHYSVLNNGKCSKAKSPVKSKGFLKKTLLLGKCSSQPSIHSFFVKVSTASSQSNAVVKDCAISNVSASVLFESGDTVELGLRKEITELRRVQSDCVPKISISSRVSDTLSSLKCSTSTSVGLVMNKPFLRTPFPNSPASSSVQSNGSTSWKTTSSGYNNRQCPFYKKITGTSFTVDAFNYGIIPDCTTYFLSHFHSDHYMGLSKNFALPIYCSKITAKLVQLKLRVQPMFIHSLSLNQPHIIRDTEVTLIEANHCPGSVMFIFKLKNNKVIVHTGDFRADESMETNSALIGLTVQQLYLDTTYCDATYVFPVQKDVIAFSVDKALNFLHINPRALIIVGSYTIGKERIFTAIAEALGSQIYVSSEKRSILNCLDDPGLSNRLTLKRTEARVHVVRMNQLNLQDLSEYLDGLRPTFDKVIAFEPTGWTHNSRLPSLANLRPKASSTSVTVYGVPYSEHSSYSEMKRFVQFLRPQRILPTVNNGNAKSRKKMEEIFHAWMTENHSVSPARTARQSAINCWLK